MIAVVCAPRRARGTSVVARCLLYAHADKNGPFRCARHENTLSPMRSLQYQNNPSHAAAARPRTHTASPIIMRAQSRVLLLELQDEWSSREKEPESPLIQVSGDRLSTRQFLIFGSQFL
jgi:hypothetical protein